MNPKVTLLPLTGALTFVLGVVLYSFATLLGILRATIFEEFISKSVIELVLWYSPIPILLGMILFGVGLNKVLLKRVGKSLRYEPVIAKNLTVALTAYNDEESIADAVRDFKSHPLVSNVIVISNNSTDSTFHNAKEVGAIVFNEPKQGYGACVKRAMSEACEIDESGVIVICEGDLTFRAYDLDKMLPYLAHADVVNGTRIVESLQAPRTQLSIFMHYGNLFVGKLLECKYLGDASLTDVGTTYKVVRCDVLRELLPRLDSDVNLTFNPYFLESAISSGYKLVEVPITFHPRVGESKGGNISNSVALKLGLKMILGIVIGWRYAK